MGTFNDLYEKMNEETASKELQCLMDDWEVKGVDVYLSEKDGVVHLHQLIVKKEDRQEGVGSKVVNTITDYADATDQYITLQTGSRDDHHGTTSSSRLKKFYKRFGFVENKGRNKNYRLSGNMFRRPGAK